MSAEKITKETVRADFNDPVAVVHYARAAHYLGLWRSERILIERHFPDRDARLLEGGCGAGRVTLGLWDLGYRHLTAFDFAEELLDQARSLARERGAERIQFLNADATRLTEAFPSAPTPAEPDIRPQTDDAATGARAPLGSPLHERARSAPPFDGALFMFNGMMQIPGRENRRAAMAELAAVCRSGATFLFTTHDRDATARDQEIWKVEAERWGRGEQDPKLVDFGDRYFEDQNGRTFMHLPDREEILTDLALAGWSPVFDAMRSEVARESRGVRDFSDECRFWVARKS